MNGRWFLPAALCCLTWGVTAQEDGTMIHHLSLQDYIIILIVGIVLLSLFVIGVNRIFRLKLSFRERSKLLTAFGLLFASFLLAAGSVCLIIGILSVLALGAQMTVFEWLVVVIIYYAAPLPYIAGLSILSFMGLILILIGVFLFIYLQGNPLQSMPGTPSSFGQLVKQDRMGLNAPEVMNPTITFKVLSLGRDDPVPNVKVVLKQANGTKFYIKTTNIEGIVVFDGVVGYGSDYYAYIEGDEDREKFRIVRLPNK